MVLPVPRARIKAGRRRRIKSALRKESDRALVEQIRRLLALPMEKRTNFLRVRKRGTGSIMISLRRWLSPALP